MKKEIIKSALNNNSDCCTYCKKEIDSVSKGGLVISAS